MEKYQIIKSIGKGSYGEVFLVKHIQDRKQYVIKKVYIKKTSMRERNAAHLEVRLLSELKHPNIVEYKESFMLDKGQYLCIVMAYCEGGDLFSKLKAQGKKLLPEKQILEYFVQITLALHYMHQRRVMHRDLKTQNIFLTKTNVVKLGDFGIAKVLESSIDMAKTMIGTPYYMSPEVLENKSYNHKSDVWSLGCVLYEMLTLRHAFDAKEMPSLIFKILRDTPAPIPSQYNSEFQHLITKMLSKIPTQRPSLSEILALPFIRAHMEATIAATKVAKPIETVEQQQQPAQKVPSVAALKLKNERDKIAEELAKEEAEKKRIEEKLKQIQKEREIQKTKVNNINTNLIIKSTAIKTVSSTPSSARRNSASKENLMDKDKKLVKKEKVDEKKKVPTKKPEEPKLEAKGKAVKIEKEKEKEKEKPPRISEKEKEMVKALPAYPKPRVPSAHRPKEEVKQGRDQLRMPVGSDVVIHAEKNLPIKDLKKPSKPRTPPSHSDGPVSSTPPNDINKSEKSAKLEKPEKSEKSESDYFNARLAAMRKKKDEERMKIESSRSDITESSSSVSSTDLEKTPISTVVHNDEKTKVVNTSNGEEEEFPVVSNQNFDDGDDENDLDETESGEIASEGEVTESNSLEEKELNHKLRESMTRINQMYDTLDQFEEHSENEYNDVINIYSSCLELGLGDTPRIDDEDGEIVDSADLMTGNLTERIAALRERCIDVLGEDLFFKVYNIMRSESPNNSETGDELIGDALESHVNNILGPHRMEYFSLIAQIIFCEDNLKM